MESEKKYYTPKAEEFCIGFEYQRQKSILTDKGWYKVNMRQWSDDVLSDSRFKTSTWDIWRDLEDGYVRVKYLDEEDILDCGFTKEGNLFVKQCDNFECWIDVLEVVNDISKVAISSDDNERSFYGLVKNKSELKKLLKQLGI